MRHRHASTASKRLLGGQSTLNSFSQNNQFNATGDGFNFSQDLALKAGLVTAEIGNVGFRVKNFDRENMGILEKR